MVLIIVTIRQSLCSLALAIVELSVSLHWKPKWYSLPGCVFKQTFMSRKHSR